MNIPIDEADIMAAIGIHLSRAKSVLICPYLLMTSRIIAMKTTSHIDRRPVVKKGSFDAHMYLLKCGDIPHKIAITTA